MSERNLGKLHFNHLELPFLRYVGLKKSFSPPERIRERCLTKTSLLSNKQGYWYHSTAGNILRQAVMIPFLVTVLTKRMVFTRDWVGVGVKVVVRVVLNQKRTTTTATTKKQQQQQQQNFIKKQIKLRKYCPQLARLLEAGQCVKNIRNKAKVIN